MDGVRATKSQCQFLLRFEKDFDLVFRVALSHKQFADLSQDLVFEKNDNRFIAVC